MSQRKEMGFRSLSERLALTSDGEKTNLSTLARGNAGSLGCKWRLPGTVGGPQIGHFHFLNDK